MKKINDISNAWENGERNYKKFPNGIYKDDDCAYILTDFDAVPILIDGLNYDLYDAPYGACGELNNPNDEDSCEGYIYTHAIAEKSGYTWKNLFNR